MHQQFETVETKQARPTESEPSVSWREQRFNPKEVSEILSIATRLQNEGVKGEQILQMADEAGIAPEYVERAIIEFLKRKWQRAEAELAMRRRLRRLMFVGGVMIALTSLLWLWTMLESRRNFSYAEPSAPPTTRYQYIVPNDTLLRASVRQGVYATSASLSVSAIPAANGSGRTITEVALWRIGNSAAYRVQIPSHSINQISIAPSEQRVALIDTVSGAVWMVNADGTGLNRIAEFSTPFTLPNGETARPTASPFAGWDGDEPILHTDKGSVRVRLSEGNTVTRIEPYQPNP